VKAAEEALSDEDESPVAMAEAETEKHAKWRGRGAITL